MPICQKCSENFPNTITIDGRRRNLQRRSFCLQCSPFGQHNTKDLCRPPVDPQRLEYFICPNCRQTLQRSEFYWRRDEAARNTYCKACANKQTVERQQRLKKQAVVYKGGRCRNCGYDRYIGSLEFHHIDNKSKELDISHSRHTNFEKLKPELDKCILLCANCHRTRRSMLGLRVCFRNLEREKGIEPSSGAWKALALPLSYSRTKC